MVKCLHTVCLSLCVADMVVCWFSCQWWFGLELVHVCVRPPKPPLTPDLLKSHDTPSIPTKSSEEGGAKVKQGNNQPGLGGIPDT